MYFLIGVIVLIAFLLIIYFYVRIRIRKTLDSAGFVGKNLSDIIAEAKLEDQEVPKSLASMDRIYLKQIQKDFPDININELKRKSEEILLDFFQAMETKDTSRFKGKIKSELLEKLSDFKDKDVSFDHFKIHNTVISNYKKEKGTATIYFSSSFQYVLNGEKVQDRSRIEFIYVIDESEVPKDLPVLGVHCPNCGSPITKLGQKSCDYCGTAVYDLVKRSFICNDIFFY